MSCYDCSLHDELREAVGLCHRCSAGLCNYHLHMAEQAITVVRVRQTRGHIALQARRLIRIASKAALEQPCQDE
jgi:hypothetical protein